MSEGRRVAVRRSRQLGFAVPVLGIAAVVDMVAVLGVVAVLGGGAALVAVAAPVTAEAAT
ncbi:hypothetical protein OG194_22335 [Streptomyces sp. NBC_01288]|uniref:hypothetical protein n=1 Tax=Streptomyces sp. NBC_01288 TaxID=2903814 RepID=UPI002E100F7C|nr:hypothetical protein OG194_22335 [Streptomyces sp. NBC_01288]